MIKYLNIGGPYDLNARIHFLLTSLTWLYLCFCFVFTVSHSPHTGLKLRGSWGTLSSAGMTGLLGLVFFISFLFIYVEVLGAEAGQEVYGWPHSQKMSYCINNFFLFTVKLFILTMLEHFLRNASSDIVLPFFNTQTSKQKLLNAGER